MPLNAKGKKIKAAMEKEYGAEKGKRVFYASENGGKIHGVVKTGEATEHHIHHLHQKGSVVHHHHHYVDGAMVVHHHYAHNKASVGHMVHPVEGSSKEEAAESPTQETVEQKAGEGLKAAFPEE